MASKEQKIERVRAYLRYCGGTDEQVDRWDYDIVSHEDTISLIGRFKSDIYGWREFFIENFTCWNEYFGWKLLEKDAFIDQFIDDAIKNGEVDVDKVYCGDFEYARRIEKRRLWYGLFDADDPFYSGEWKHIPPEIASQCCKAVQDRIKVGI